MSRLLFRADTTAMDCHAVGEVLPRCLDGYIDAERARLVAAHLGDCRRCGLDSQTYLHVKATLAAQRRAVPEESLARLRSFGERLARGEEPLTT